MTREVIEQMKELLGPKGWVAADEAESFVTDITGRGADCILVARPSSTGQVAQLVRLCGANDIAIIPQGGNTNVCKMAVPLEGQRALVLCLARMNNILEINSKASTATVEAGCLTIHCTEPDC